MVEIRSASLKITYNDSRLVYDLRLGFRSLINQDTSFISQPEGKRKVSFVNLVPVASQREIDKRIR
jgi:hypothetical protein